MSPRTALSLAASCLLCALISASALRALAAAPLAPEVAAPGPLPEPGSGAWLPLTFARIERQTRYGSRQGRDGAGSVLEARADCSASGLILRFPVGLDLERTPRLRWRWRVEDGLSVDDERSKSGDDFAARVYALFEFDAAGASAWQRIRRRLGAALYGEGLPGKAITYVWTSRVSPGETWTNPYSEDTQMLALRGGLDAGWHTETVNLLADHERLLGPARMPMMAIALMTDSDDTCQQAEASYAGFELLPPETEGGSEP